MERRCAIVLALTMLVAFPPALRAEAAPSGELRGKVLETMNSGGYTYVQLERQDGGKQWVAMPELQTRAGQELSLLPGHEMRDFESKTLKRTFETIVFSPGPAGSAPAGDGKLPAGHPPLSQPAAEKIEVEKAAGPNGRRVAEVFEQSSLDKQAVAVRGKVVKVSRAIMGKNWIHIQDGSGAADKATHDLVVTSQDAPAVGDIVTVEGTVYRDKDFGSGYRYAVIVEEATVRK